MPFALDYRERTPRPWSVAVIHPIVAFQTVHTKVFILLVHEAIVVEEIRILEFTIVRLVLEIFCTVN